MNDGINVRYGAAFPKLAAEFKKSEITNQFAVPVDDDCSPTYKAGKLAGVILAMSLIRSALPEAPTSQEYALLSRIIALLEDHWVSLNRQLGA